MGREPHELKRAPRIDLRRPAILIDSNGRETSVIVLDISSGGFRLEVPDGIAAGETVRLRVERGEEYPAQIRWSLASEAGGVFLEPVGDLNG